MPTVRIMLAAVLLIFCVSGCADMGERFQRFEAWKMETFFGQPPDQPGGPNYNWQQPAYAAQPGAYPAYGTQPAYGQQNVAYPPFTSQPMPTLQQMPAMSQPMPSQPMTGPGQPPLANPVARPIVVPSGG